MKRNKCREITVEAFPKIGGQFFEENWCASATCWVAGDWREVDRRIEENLDEEGWEIVEVTYRGLVRPSMFEEGDPRRRYVEEALSGGFNTQIRLVPREVVEISDDPDDWIDLTTESYRDFVLAAQRGVYSFWRPEPHSNWATGVTENGNDFLPLWNSADDAAKWQDQWSEYELVLISPKCLAETGGLLHAVDEKDMAVGLGISGAIVMSHPIALQRDISLGITRPSLKMTPMRL